MGLLHNSKVYLAGSIEYNPDGKGGTIWRNDITPILQEMGIRVYNPMRKPSWYPRNAVDKNPSSYVNEVIEHMDCKLCSDIKLAEQDGHWSLDHCYGASQVAEAYDAVKFIEDMSFRFIHDCEWVIAYVPRTFTVGTIDELRIAVDAKKPIFIVCPDVIPSSWMMGMASTQRNYGDVFFKTMDECVEHIRKIDRGAIQLDPKQWIWLSYFNEDIKLKPKHNWI